MTAARATIEADEWTDLRYDALARLLRLPGGRDHALVLCMRIRSWQTEHYTPEAPTYCIPAELADGVLGDGGAAALVRARLAVETPEGLFILDSDRPGRIDWLHKLSAAGYARRFGDGSDATSRSRNRKSKHKEVAAAQPAAPAPAEHKLDSLSSSSPEEELSPARVAPPAPAPAAKPIGSSDDPERVRRRKLGAELWRELGDQRAAIAAEHGLDARPLPLQAHDIGGRALAGRLSGAGNETELAEVVESARHVIAVAAAEARASTPPSVQWLTGALFEDRSWRRALGMTVADASRSRAGPRGAERSLPTEPTRRIKTL